MELVSEIGPVVSNRGDMYRLLARLYQVEIDAAFLERLTQIDWSVETDEKEIREGYHLLDNYLKQRGPDTITDLAVDYARLFLGAGLTGQGAAFPYESVYTSRDRLIMQDARDRVVQFYYAEGLDKAQELEIPEDHIALEMEFMACLCDKTYASLSAEDLASAVDLLAKQKSFLEQHLARWVPAFCGDIEHNASTDFYRAVAKITVGYVQMERPLVNSLIQEIPVTTLAPVQGPIP